MKQYIGYLHDIIEDTNYNYDFIKDKYGKNIADGVLLISENKNISDYIERKKRFYKQNKKYQ